MPYGRRIADQSSYRNGVRVSGRYESEQEAVITEKKYKTLLIGGIAFGVIFITALILKKTKNAKSKKR